MKQDGRQRPVNAESSRAVALFAQWNATPQRRPEDKFVTIGEFEWAIEDLPDGTDREIVDLVMRRAVAQAAEGR